MAGFFYSEDYLQDFRSLNGQTLTDTCSIFPHLEDTSNGRGGDSETNLFGATILNVPCRKDGFNDRLLPQRSKDNIDVDKIMSTIYVPMETVVDIQDEVETDAGNEDGTVLRYRVLDVDRETDEVDLALLVEIVN